MSRSRTFFFILLVAALTIELIGFFHTRPQSVPLRTPRPSTAPAKPPKPPVLKAVPLYERVFNNAEALHKMTEKVFAGHSTYTIEGSGAAAGLLAESVATSSMLYEEVKIPVGARPILNWEWSVEEFPTNKKNEKLGDRGDNDFALRVYAFFKGTTLWNSRVIQYVWDDHFAEGESASSAFSANVRIWVAQHSDQVAANEWQIEERDVYKDYEELFGEPANLPLAAVGVMTDSDNTRTRSKARVKYLRLKAGAPAQKSAPGDAMEAMIPESGGD